VRASPSCHCSSSPKKNVSRDVRVYLAHIASKLSLAQLLPRPSPESLLEPLPSVVSPAPTFVLAGSVPSTLIPVDRTLPRRVNAEVNSTYPLYSSPSPVDTSPCAAMAWGAQGPTSRAARRRLLHVSPGRCARCACPRPLCAPGGAHVATSAGCTAARADGPARPRRNPQRGAQCAPVPGATRAVVDNAAPAWLSAFPTHHALGTACWPYHRAAPAQPLALLRDTFTKPRALVSPKCVLSACTCIRVRAARRRVSYDARLPVDSPVYPLPPHMHVLSPLVSPLPSCRALESSCAVRTCCARRRAR
jgi:hypothetical protein